MDFPPPSASVSHRGPLAPAEQPHVTGPACTHVQQEHLTMKAVRIILLAALAVSLAAPALYAEPRQLMPGTQIHPQLLTEISTGAAKAGAPFMAVVTEAVALGDQLSLTAGSRVNGILSTITKARRFSLLRGEAYLNLSFRYVEIDSRLIPVQMSLLAIDK